MGLPRPSQLVLNRCSGPFPTWSQASFSSRTAYFSLLQPHRSSHSSHFLFWSLLWPLKQSVPQVSLSSRDFLCPSHIEQMNIFSLSPSWALQKQVHLICLWISSPSYCPAIVWLCFCEGKGLTFAKCLHQAPREACGWKTAKQISWEQSLCNKPNLDAYPCSSTF